MHTAALFALLPFLGSALAAPLNKRDTGVFIYSGRDNKCLSLPAGQSAGDGTPVVSVDCNGTGVSKWDINRGSGSVVLSGTNYALDIGLSPGNNGALKVWTSYPTAAQQTWYYTDDNRIAQTGGTQCLDEGDNGIQTYECTTGNTNQVFYTRGSTTPATSSSSAAPPPASSSAAPPPPTNQGSVILANNYVNLCLTVQDNDFANGTPVDVANCMNPSFSASERAGQIWDVTPGSTGAIKVLGTDYCLDAGSNPEDGSGMKIWQCYDGLLQQTWNVAPDGGLIALSNNQCLDVTKEDQPSPGYIYGNSNPVQTWTCSGDDQQQQFSVRASNSAF